MGAAFGNARCWIDTRGSGEIEHLFSCDLGKVVFGAIAVRYAGFSSRMVNLKRGAASAEHRQGQRKSFIRLRPEGQGMVEITPATSAMSSNYLAAWLYAKLSSSRAVKTRLRIRSSRLSIRGTRASNCVFTASLA
ncbi:MAG TPA: hypothetical protein VIR57_18195 [Chloroflexota bacterium]